MVVCARQSRQRSRENGSRKVVSLYFCGLRMQIGSLVVVGRQQSLRSPFRFACEVLFVVVVVLAVTSSCLASVVALRARVLLLRLLVEIETHFL